LAKCPEIVLEQDHTDDSNTKYITLFPHGHLKDSQHLINPHKHYKVLGKEAIIESKVNQPKSFVWYPEEGKIQDIPIPFALKATHGLSGDGTWLIRKEEDRSKVSKINFIGRGYKRMVVSELLDYVHNYCIHFYVSKDPKRDVLLGVTRQIIDSNGGWDGSSIDFTEQDTLFVKLSGIVNHLSEYLRKNDYFGIVGVDVLENASGELFVIDLNPRINGSTCLCLLRKHMTKHGKFKMHFLGEVKFNTSPDKVLSLLNDLVHENSVFVFGLADLKDENMTSCFLASCGSTQEELLSVEKSIHSFADLSLS